MEMQQYSNVVGALNRSSAASTERNAAAAAATTAASTTGGSSSSSTTNTTTAAATATTSANTTMTSATSTAAKVTPAAAETGARPKVRPAAPSPAPAATLMSSEVAATETGQEVSPLEKEEAPGSGNLEKKEGGSDSGCAQDNGNSEANELRRRRLAKFESPAPE